MKNYSVPVSASCIIAGVRSARPKREIFLRYVVMAVVLPVSRRQFCTLVHCNTLYDSRHEKNAAAHQKRVLIDRKRRAVLE